MRYSEKLLEQHGHLRGVLDLSEIFGRAWNLKDKDSAVLSKIDEIKDYVTTTDPEESLTRMAKFAVVLDSTWRRRELVGDRDPVLDLDGGVLRRRALHRHEHDEQRA